MDSEIDVELDDVINRRAALIGAIENGSLDSLDGVMSPVSQSLAERLGTQQFDMNSWWVATPTYWICPGCGREKSEIARLNTNGEIMCHLVEHHDHMTDVLKRRFQEISISREKVIANAEAEKFAKRSSMMISAFENTIVCVDCNNADAVAKKIVKAHPDFSFSSQELRQFVNPTSNQPHQVIEKIAEKIWIESERTFELRLKIADRIAQIAANNEHWFQPGIYGSNPEIITRRAVQVVSDWNASGVLQELKGSRKKRPTRSVSAWRLTQYPAIKVPPTKNEIEHAGLVTIAKFWALIDEEWKCPGCQRKKRELVRKNKDGEWTFPMGKRYLFNTEAPWSRIDTLACGDCLKVAEDLGREAAFIANKKVQGFAAKVSVDEVRRCVIPQAHSRHNINNAVSDEILKAIAQRITLAID